MTGGAEREWLVSNGLGGYASGPVCGNPTRRYHGLLVAALPPPFGRMVMLNHLDERVRLPGGAVVALESPCAFRLDVGLPMWRYDLDGTVIEKRLHAVSGRNTVLVSYRLEAGDGPVRLMLRPSLAFRPHDRPLTREPHPYTVTGEGGRWEISAPGLPSLRLCLPGAEMTDDGAGPWEAHLPVEALRGYDFLETLWSLGTLSVDLSSGEEAELVVSTEPWEHLEAASLALSRTREVERRRGLLATAALCKGSGEGLGEGPAEALVLAADAFLVAPPGRAGEASVIAGYHWFSDWGRDTMISLEGLALVTGRHADAERILRAFARHVRDGLVPNLFPDGSHEGVYNTADATLWFFHAIDRTLAWSGNRTLLVDLLPTLDGIIRHHLHGTRFGIGVDPMDGLLRQGAEGTQLTWMDAKVEGWVVTPRHGKAVEINALWYNALRLMEGWTREVGRGGDSAAMGALADQVRVSFNRRFWYAEGGYLYDVLGEGGAVDSALRPNQIFALSLPHPVLDEARWEPVLCAVRDHLLTPFGLRTLAPGHPDYKPRCEGDLRTRDAAYHQGTVWAWLIGPFVDGWLRVWPDDRAGVRRLLAPLLAHVDEAGVGSISEIFDAEPPYTPRGCIAQAWSVAETLRAWVKTGGEGGDAGGIESRRG